MGEQRYVIHKLALILCIACAPILLACVNQAKAASKTGEYPSNLTGSWGGLRGKLHDRGVDVIPYYWGSFAGNLTGGTHTTDAYTQLFGILATLDFQRLLGWRGASLHINMQHRNGTLIDLKAGLGDFLDSQAIYVGTRNALINFYLQQMLFGNHLGIQLGRMGYNASYFQLPCDFQSLVFCSSLPMYILPRTLVGGASGQLGANVLLNFSRTFTAKVGIFKVNPNDTHTGIFLRAKGKNIGNVWTGEFDWHTHFSNGGAGRSLSGVWAVGGWYGNTRNPDLFISDEGLPFLTTNTVPRTHDHIYGWYLQGIQEVMPATTAHGRLRLLVNYVHADPDVVVLNRFISVGVLYNGPFSSRPTDRAGFILGSECASNPARMRDALLLHPVSRCEYRTEINYDAKLPHGVQVMPDIQYIYRPGGIADRHPAIIFGTRIILTF